MSAEERIFIDTNVFVYLLSEDARKADISEALLRDSRYDRVTSTQVVNELVNTARKKAGLEWHEIRFVVDTVREACRVETLIDDDQDLAFDVAETRRFQWFDSLIIASALRARASRLLSEDFQDGQTIEDLTISDPFRR